VKANAEETQRNTEETQRNAEETQKNAEETQKNAEETQKNAEETQENAEETQENARETRKSAGETRWKEEGKPAIANRQKRMRIPRGKLRGLVKAILAGEGRRLALSFAFVGGAEMRRLNRRYLRHDFDTDVLSFPLDGDSGEIVISTDFAAREAAKRGIPEVEELLRYAVHGVLHLLGYDDHAPAAKRRMWAVQERYVRGAVGR
jgi:rRNA maturation RNase YbeY